MSAPKTDALPLGDTPVAPGLEWIARDSVNALASIGGRVKPSFNALRTLSILLPALLLIGGCPQTSPGPEASLRQFLDHVKQGRGADAFRSLTQENQKVLLDKMHSLRGAEEGADAAGAFLFDEFGLSALSDPENIVIVSPIGKEVRLRVSVEQGRSADIRLVQEGGHWSVDLLGSMNVAEVPG
jgi:hypothetical protein